MDNLIKPIETYYKGYRFRSRLEARWAVFFDSLGVDYEYEPEGFDLGDGIYYLPDFRVKCYGKRGDHESNPFDLWIEVKGKMSESDARKIKKFCGDVDEYGYVIPENPILIVGKIPDVSPFYYDQLGECSSAGYELEYFSYLTVDGDCSFGAYPAADDKGHFYLFGADSNYINSEDVPRTINAYKKARQARFEHGEKG